MKISLTGNGLLSFPPKQEILQHLRQHYLTSEKSYPYLTEHKIIEAISSTFANSREYPLGFKNSIKIVLFAQRLNLPKKIRQVMQAHLFLALFSCAEGKQNYKCYIHGHRPLTHLDSLNSIQSRSSPHPNSMLLVDEEERHSALPKKNRFLFCG